MHDFLNELSLEEQLFHPVFVQEILNKGNTLVEKAGLYVKFADKVIVA